MGGGEAGVGGFLFKSSSCIVLPDEGWVVGCAELGGC